MKEKYNYIISDLHIWPDRTIDQNWPYSKKEEELMEKKLIALQRFITEKVDSCLQLWDLSVIPDIINELTNEFDKDKLKILWWNRDNYDTLIQKENFLSDFWITNIWSTKISYIRWTETHNKQKKYIYDKEVLSLEQLMNAIDFFKKPENQKEIMITHETLEFIADILLWYKSSWIKKELLDMIFDNKFHPKYWIFWHHHTRFYIEINWTKFIWLWEADSLKINNLNKIYSLKSLNRYCETIRNNDLINIKK